jgi:hypothetical protein
MIRAVVIVCILVAGIHLGVAVHHSMAGRVAQIERALAEQGE